MRSPLNVSGVGVRESGCRCCLQIAEGVKVGRSPLVTTRQQPVHMIYRAVPSSEQEPYASRCFRMLIAYVAARLKLLAYSRSRLAPACQHATPTIEGAMVDPRTRACKHGHHSLDKHRMRSPKGISARSAPIKATRRGHARTPHFDGEAQAGSEGDRLCDRRADVATAH